MASFSQARSAFEVFSFLTTVTNGTNALTSNNQYATFTIVPEVGIADFGGSFDFDIPTNATITGMVVRIEAKAAASSSISIVLASVTSDTEEESVPKEPTDPLLTSDNIFSYGGSSDMWGTTFTVAQINAEFGAGYYFSGNGSLISVDHLEATIYYTIPTKIKKISKVSLSSIKKFMGVSKSNIKAVSKITN